jgi:hydrogenase maturation protease
VLGWGNVSRGDDALGPLLMARVEAAGCPHVRCVEDYQLQIDHALDLVGCDLALFVDAGRGTAAPFTFSEIHARPGLSHTSHGISPESVLDVYMRVRTETPPPAFVLCVRGDSFEVEEGLSTQAREALELAWTFLEALLAAPSLSDWRERMTPFLR